MEGFESIARMLLSLLVVAGGMGALVWFARRHRMGSGFALRVVHRMPVAKNASLVVVDTGQRHLLLGISEKGVNLVSELEPGEFVAPEPNTTTGKGFAGAFKGARGLLAAPGAKKAELARLRGSMQGDRTAGPGTGLLERLQHMTLRTHVEDSLGAPDS